MAEETFFGYKDISEKGFIEWSLGYTMDPIIECFLAIPGEQRYKRVLDKLSAPCRILGHIALNEETLLKGFARGIRKLRCPFPARLFDIWQAPTDDELRKAIPDSEKLVTYWRDVRTDTHEYLEALTADDLRRRPEKSVLPESDGNRNNPIREFFIMAIQHQNCHWGELRAICKILDVETRW